MARKTTALGLIVVIMLSFLSVPAFANDAVILQSLGLKVESSIMQSRVGSTPNAVPGVISISAISESEAVRISSKADIELLLFYVEKAEEQQTGLHFDTAVTDAISSAGLDEYWKDGVRRITQPSREAALIDLASQYSLNELTNMGLFDRPGMLKEFQNLGYFQDELETALLARANTMRRINSQTVYSYFYDFGFLLLPGDIVNYFIDYVYAIPGTGYTQFYVGLHTPPGSGVGLYQSYYAAQNRMTSTGGFVVASKQGYFGILNGYSDRPFNISGDYQVTW